MYGGRNRALGMGWVFGATEIATEHGILTANLF